MGKSPVVSVLPHVIGRDFRESEPGKENFNSHVAIEPEADAFIRDSHWGDDRRRVVSNGSVVSF